MTSDIQREADIQGQYRYSLTRQWGNNGNTFVVIGLNPSMADASKDDATIRVLMYWGKRNDFSRLLMLNLYAYVATDPADLFRAGIPAYQGAQSTDIIGPHNTCQDLCERIHREMKADQVKVTIPVVFAAWGNHGINRGRELINYARTIEFAPIASNLCCFNVTKLGAPRHPLRNTLKSIPYIFPPKARANGE